MHIIDGIDPSIV